MLLGVTPPPMGLAGRGAMPPLPMPGAGEAGRGDWAIGGVMGFGATGAAAGLGAAGFAATGLRAAALRAGFRAAVLVVLRADVFRAAVLRAVARLAPVFLAPVLRAVFRTVRAVLRAVLRPARAVFRALLRGLAFLLVVRFFPLILVAMVSAPICSDAALDRPNGRVLARITVHWSRLAVSPGESIVFFHYTMIVSESGNLACRTLATRRITASCPGCCAAKGRPERLAQGLRV